MPCSSCLSAEQLGALQKTIGYFRDMEHIRKAQVSWIKYTLGLA